MDLSTIKNTGNWGISASRLNENFSKVGTEVDKLKYAAYNSKLYASEDLLKQAIPSPSVGDWAIVGNAIPGEIYRCDTDGEWTATGQTGGGYGMEVTEKHVTEQYVTEVHNEYTGDIVNNPDDEDLISEEKPEGSKVLKLADKMYNASAFSGLGRVYLRKNVTASKNILTQAMISNANTRYVIQYDYDLNGQTITIPEGCVLDFQGGILRNGILIGQHTKMTGEISIINCTGDGIYDVDRINVKQFGAKGDGTDDTTAFNNALSFIKAKNSYINNTSAVTTLYIPNGLYKINNVIVTNCSIVGESVTSTIIQTTDDNEGRVVFEHRQTSTYGPKTIISNIYFSNGIFYNRKTSVEFNNCFFGSSTISIYQASDILISNSIFDMTADGVKIEMCANITVSNNIFFSNALRAIHVVSGQNIFIYGNNFNECYGRPILIQSGSFIIISTNNFQSKDEDINDTNPAFVKLSYTGNPSYEYPFDSIIINDNNFYCKGLYNGVYVDSTRTITNFVVKHNEIINGIRGVHIVSGASKARILNNTFVDSLYNNIWANVGNIIINNNTFIDGGRNMENDTFQSSVMVQNKGAVITKNIQRYTEPSKFKYWVFLNGSSSADNYSIISDNILQKYDNSLYIKDVFGETDYGYVACSNEKNEINRIPNIDNLGLVVTPYDNMKVFVDSSSPLYYNNANWMNEDGTLLKKVILLFKTGFTKQNFIYKIMSDIDLQGEEITIPSGCTLDFQGGKIINGTIILTDTKILPFGCNISEYISANIKGTYRKGQMLYDENLKMMKFWNGIAWATLDSTMLM